VRKQIINVRVDLPDEYSVWPEGCLTELQCELVVAEVRTWDLVEQRDSSGGEVEFDTYIDGYAWLLGHAWKITIGHKIYIKRQS
jgi:hypothetical protein